MAERMCKIFLCALRKGHYCCADCTLRETCSVVCLNDPDRCREQAGAGETGLPKMAICTIYQPGQNPNSKKKHCTARKKRAQPSSISMSVVQSLLAKGYTCAAVAERLDVSVSAITRRRAILVEEGKLYAKRYTSR